MTSLDAKGKKGIEKLKFKNQIGSKNDPSLPGSSVASGERSKPGFRNEPCQNMHNSESYKSKLS